MSAPALSSAAAAPERPSLAASSSGVAPAWSRGGGTIMTIQKEKARAVSCGVVRCVKSGGGAGAAGVYWHLGSAEDTARIHTRTSRLRRLNPSVGIWVLLAHHQRQLTILPRTFHRERQICRAHTDPDQSSSMFVSPHIQRPVRTRSRASLSTPAPSSASTTSTCPPSAAHLSARAGVRECTGGCVSPCVCVCVCV